MANDATTRPPVGVIGLGLMGSALCLRLLEAGYSVHVFNRTPSKADALLARGARWSDNPLVDCDRVLVSLYTTAVVDRVLRRLADGLRPGQIVLDTTTGDPQQTADLGAWLAGRGVVYLEAPLSGSSAEARRGEAVAIVGGRREALAAGQDLLDCVAAKSHYVGPWGNAARMKLVTNLVLGLNRAALAEGLAFARAVGLEMADALTVLGASAAYSRTMETKGQKMVDGDFRPQAKLTQHLKDVRLILAEAARHGLGLPLSSQHRRVLEQLDAAGLGHLDNSVILRAYDDAT